ncbi:MAG: hypothetical protein AB7G11_13475 [Phycisphaerales bacterium]
MASRISRIVSALSLAALLGAGGLAFTFGSSASAQPTGERPNQPERRQPGRDGGPGGPGGEGRRGPQGSVEQGMKMMNGAARQLGAIIGDGAKQADQLKLINDMQRGAVMAKGLPVPADVLEKAKDGDKDKIAKTFRSNLIKLTRALLDLEEMVADGKTAEAKTKFDEIVKMKDAGHSAMGLKEKE